VQLELVDDDQKSQGHDGIESEVVAGQLAPETLDVRLAGDPHRRPSLGAVALLLALHLGDDVAAALHERCTTSNSVKPAYSPMRLPWRSSMTTVTSWWFCSAGSTPASGISSLSCREVVLTTETPARSCGARSSMLLPGAMGSRSTKTAKRPSRGALKSCARQLTVSGCATVVLICGEVICRRSLWRRRYGPQPASSGASSAMATVARARCIIGAASVVEGGVVVLEAGVAALAVEHRVEEPVTTRHVPVVGPDLRRVRHGVEDVAAQVHEAVGEELRVERLAHQRLSALLQGEHGAADVEHLQGAGAGGRGAAGGLVGVCLDGGA